MIIASLFSALAFLTEITTRFASVCIRVNTYHPRIPRRIPHRFKLAEQRPNDTFAFRNLPGRSAKATQTPGHSPTLPQNFPYSTVC